ncbi:MAG: hypothetical protein COT85_01660 [Chlamydiae bacterium CG10_big_fil_rev_8_21_14_0_10_42_34]|nr:MAG: hypothetical protein COT85_01660 [Chlamydiae bacterium CG10_big_fil_rev_8_21_14_0_10_42_34]
MIFSKTYSTNQHFWHESQTIAFDELILSWNGLRPLTGKWTFWVSLQQDQWLKIAEWGPNFQRSFESKASLFQNHQDLITSQKLCTEFWVKVEGEELDKLHSMTVSVSDTRGYIQPNSKPLAKVHIKGILPQSQMVLNHHRHKELCSPTSATTALRYLTKDKSLCPLDFASKVHDDVFDIYGNWMLNIAECYNRSKIPCHVERLKDFETLHSYLLKNIPVVISMKGEIPGGAKPYDQGHLICITGYENNRVYCIDPAFQTNEITSVSYSIDDFLKAWGRRRGLSYIFT